MNIKRKEIYCLIKSEVKAKAGTNEESMLAICCQCQLRENRRGRLGNDTDISDLQIAVRGRLRVRVSVVSTRFRFGGRKFSKCACSELKTRTPI